MGVPPAVVRLARLVALAVGGFLLPWCVVLGLSLPASAHVQNWPLAWIGLDGGEAAMALATAVLLARSDVRASLTAMAGAALLLADAWFDICTSAAGTDRLISVAEAAFAEVPLALAASWLAISLLRARDRQLARSSSGAVRLNIVIHDRRSISSAPSKRPATASAGVAASAAVAVRALAGPPREQWPIGGSIAGPSPLPLPPSTDASRP